eukprot:CAMPEP_0173356088 /NCGR_PEP_ID=MMETSP1144-20121109/18119_1 /TAXON_ID=483371 /ORGANISM="non described non described, Strain CCMP2298" /LENGTH=128 /DNA_ID=CAMNT_0014304855 /DNA_START=294 /DNA_END=679 /DNA_ORIENTATION=+
MLLCDVTEAAVPAVLVVHQAHRGVLHAVLRGQRGAVYEWIVQRVDGDGRHADPVQPALGPARLVVVELVPESIDLGDVGFVKCADGVCRPHSLDVKVPRQPLPLPLRLHLESLEEVLIGDWGRLEIRV